jgi:hypothetical protein
MGHRQANVVVWQAVLFVTALASISLYSHPAYASDCCPEGIKGDCRNHDCCVIQQLGQQSQIDDDLVTTGYRICQDSFSGDQCLPSQLYDIWMEYCHYIVGMCKNGANCNAVSSAATCTYVVITVPCPYGCNPVGPGPITGIVDPIVCSPPP